MTNTAINHAVMYCKHRPLTQARPTCPRLLRRNAPNGNPVHAHRLPSLAPSHHQRAQPTGGTGARTFPKFALTPNCLHGCVHECDDHVWSVIIATAKNANVLWVLLWVASLAQPRAQRGGPSPTVLPVLSFSFPFLPVAGLKSRYITAGGVTPGKFFGKLRAIWCILETFLHSSIHLGFATLANITFLIFRSMDDITKSQIGVGPSISVYP